MDGNLIIKEVFVNKTEDVIYYQTDLVDSGFSDVQALFEAKKEEHGNPVSKVFVDDPDNPDNPISLGWVFQSESEYDDPPYGKFDREVWVTIEGRKRGEKEQMAPYPEGDVYDEFNYGEQEPV